VSIPGLSTLPYFRHMSRAVLLLGSNQGNRKANLSVAINRIGGEAGQVYRESRIYETAAWGDTSQDSYYNQVVIIETELEAGRLMQTLLFIEKEMGRTRVRKWEPRIIDIDILYFNDAVINEKDLVIPHPLLHERKFTLIPLAEVLPEFIHPVLKKNTLKLLAICTDSGEVKEVID
jgi:2-amino-4-hydroxy-6-hydroxymethyldihydropteridine diphosphokinase